MMGCSNGNTARPDVDNDVRDRTHKTEMTRLAACPARNMLFREFWALAEWAHPVSHVKKRFSSLPPLQVSHYYNTHALQRLLIIKYLMIQWNSYITFEGSVIHPFYKNIFKIKVNICPKYQILHFILAKKLRKIQVENRPTLFIVGSFARPL